MLRQIQVYVVPNTDVIGAAELRVAGFQLDWPGLWLDRAEETALRPCKDYIFESTQVCIEAAQC
jgi:hypothetical protein